MNINEIFNWSGSLVAFLLYYPLISGILRGKIEQSFATWILWVSLDAIALVSIILQKGNFLLLAFYCGCGTVVVVCLICKRQFKWTKFETLILMLVIICLVVWSLSGSRWATIASTLAVCIASVPQMRDLKANPIKTTGFIYLGYAIANLLSFLGGKSWSIEERFYPGLMVPICLLTAWQAFRKPEQTTQKRFEKLQYVSNR